MMYYNVQLHGLNIFSDDEHNIKYLPVLYSVCLYMLWYLFLFKLFTLVNYLYVCHIFDSYID